MKKSLLIALFVVAMVASLLPLSTNVHSYSSSPPTGYTNAPSESNCAVGGCHSGHALSTSSTNITLTADSPTLFTNGYVGGAVYTLTFSLPSGSNTYGFEMTCLTAANAKAGTFGTSSATSGIQSSGGRQYIGHVNASSTRTWIFTWTAPAAGTGSVTMYGIGNVSTGSQRSAFIYANTFTIKEVPAPCNLSTTITAVNDTCFGCSNGSLTANPSGGTAPFTYIWNTGDATQTSSHLTAGGYSVTVTDANSCTATASSTVTQPAATGIDNLSINNVKVVATIGGNITLSGIANNELVFADVFDINGKLLLPLLHEKVQADFNQSFNTQTLTSGIYLVRVMVGNQSIVKRIAIVK